MRKELFEKCPKCDGQGWTAEHDPYDPHEGGVCSRCPIQVQCEHCEARGFVPAESPVSEPQPETLSGFISREEAKKYLLDFAEFIAQGNYEHDAAKLPQQLTYWNEVDDPQRHSEDGPECLTNHELFLEFEKENKMPLAVSEPVTQEAGADREIEIKIEELEYQIEECRSVIDKGKTGDEIEFSLNDFISDLEDRINDLSHGLSKTPEASKPVGEVSDAVSELAKIKTKIEEWINQASTPEWLCEEMSQLFKAR